MYNYFLALASYLSSCDKSYTLDTEKITVLGEKKLTKVVLDEKTFREVLNLYQKEKHVTYLKSGVVISITQEKKLELYSRLECVKKYIIDNKISGLGEEYHFFLLNFCDDMLWFCGNKIFLSREFILSLDTQKKESLKEIFYVMIYSRLVDDYIISKLSADNLFIMATKGQQLTAKEFLVFFKDDIEFKYSKLESGDSDALQDLQKLASETVNIHFKAEGV